MRSVVGTLARRRSSARPSLPYFFRASSNRIPSQQQQQACRSFALSAEVGRGNAPKLDSSTTLSLHERTPAQHKQALVEHEQMVKSTQRIVSLDSLTPASVQELRVVFHYWTGTRSHLVLDNSEKHTSLQHAESLLEWMLAQNIDSSLLYTVLRSDECASGALVNLMEQYLMPFRGTHQSLKTVADKRLRFHQNVQQLKSALVNATRLMDLLQKFLDDPSYPELVPDVYSNNMVMNLWVKRCWFLAEHGDEIIDEDFVKTALRGVSSVQECLHAMKDCMDSLDVSHVNPTSCVSLYLSAWANSGLPNRAHQAHAILRQAQEDPLVNLTTVAYNTVLHAYASSVVYDKENAIRAEEFLNDMRERGDVECDVASYSSLLLAHANAGNVHRANELLLEMEHEAAKEENERPYPNTICYNIVLDALAKRGTVEAAEQADALIERMQRMSKEGVNPQASPDNVSFTCVIQAWSKSSSRQAAERAEALLLQCRDASTKNKSVSPDVVMYNMVLQACAGQRLTSQERNSQRVDETGVRRAESLLQQMKHSNNVSPDVYSYNILMNVWYNSGNYKRAASRARELLEEMKQAHGAGNDKVKPDAITYNTVIKLICQSGIRGSFDEAKSLMDEMGAEGPSIQAMTYNTVMGALVKSNEPNAVRKVEEMFQDMERMYQEGNKSVRPTESTFNILLNAYAKSKDPRDAAKAEQLLNRMIESSENDNNNAAGPSVQTFATVLDGYARNGQADAAESLFNKMNPEHVNTVSYNTVLNALARSRDKDAPYRAEALLNRMQKEYEEGNENVRPNSISFSSLLNTWAKSGLDGAAEHAEAILTRMEDLAARGNPHVIPNEVCYSTVLHAWSKDSAPDSAERAIAILTRMEDAYRNGKKYAKPNAYCYNATINAVAKSNIPDKAMLAEKLLNRMIQAYKNGNESAKPSVTSFSTLINACAYTHAPEHRQEAFRIARTCFADFLESDYGVPNVVTYVNFLTACYRLLPNGPVRDNVMSTVFRECHKDGLVNNKVIDILRKSVDPLVFRECMTSQNRQRRKVAV